MSEVPRFKNRPEAGQLLVPQLQAYAQDDEVLILALPRGGVPVAFAVAQALQLELDILLVRKLGVPGHEEYAMGAIASGGWSVLQQDVVQTLGIPSQAVEAKIWRESAEIARREQLYRSQQPAPQLKDRIVILIDDGLAAGSTMLVAVQAVSAAKPARIVVAVPVASRQACEALEEIVDEMICLRVPEPFHAVGLWYENFDQTSDEEVMQLLEQARHAQEQRTILHNGASHSQRRASQPPTPGAGKDRTSKA